MNILIKGMELPEFGEKIIILTSSGYVEDVSGQVIEGVEAIPVPPHGRLGDLDMLKAQVQNLLAINTTPRGDSIVESCYKQVLKLISDVPTIIPAEEEK